MRRYLIFGSAGLSILMFSIDSTVVAVTIPLVFLMPTGKKG